MYPALKSTNAICRIKTSTGPHDMHGLSDIETYRTSIKSIVCDTHIYSTHLRQKQAKNPLNTLVKWTNIY
jgi:hypothetical protein